MHRLIDRGQGFLARPAVPGQRTSVAELLLITWFGLLASFNIGATIRSSALGWDALIYHGAARALLAGGDPWGPVGTFSTFAGPPPSLLPYLPTAWLPEGAVVTLWTTVAALSAIYVLQRLRLPAWWLLFPPVTVAILAGSSALPVMALVVRGGALGDGAAVAARVYTALPLVLLGRWRGLLVAAAIVFATAPMLDWSRFVNDMRQISATLAEQSSGGQSATAVPWLIPIAVMCLFLLGRRRAAWLLVPALWPYTQGYYAVIALPVLAEAPLVAIALSVNAIPGLVVPGLIAQVVVERLRIWPPPGRGSSSP
ncbi:MAG: hypothetical protein ACRDJY_08295 [Thermoleophilaceae bacterium]